MVESNYFDTSSDTGLYSHENDGIHQVIRRVPGVDGLIGFGCGI